MRAALRTIFLEATFRATFLRAGLLRAAVFRAVAFLAFRFLAGLLRATALFTAIFFLAGLRVDLRTEARARAERPLAADRRMVAFFARGFLAVRDIFLALDLVAITGLLSIVQEKTGTPWRTGTKNLATSSPQKLTKCNAGGVIWVRRK